MAYEDFSDGYTEVDVPEYLTIATTKVTFAIFNQTNVYIYKSFGADYFDALNTIVEMKILNTSTAGRYGGVCFTTTLVGGVQSLGSYDIFQGISYQGGVSAYVWMWGNGVTYFDYWTGGINDTVYYNRIERAAGSNDVTTKIYDDSARTNLQDTLSMSGVSTVKWEYFMPFNDWDIYSAGMYGYIDKVDFTGGGGAGGAPSWRDVLQVYSSNKSSKGGVGGSMPSCPCNLI